ncbi:MAG: transcriptional regulator [Candidatus Saccharibacteria bacterium]|nr:transcriptional regulator [Candidatus Saccharibacteria bacterium]
MIEQLFGSKTRVKLLQLFYSNPNRSFYVREITRKIDEQINSVRRELSNLLSIGIISSDTNNNRLYYEVNQDFEHHKSLSKIFGGSNDGVVNEDKPEESDEAQAYKTLGNVDLVIYTGQFTRDQLSGVDLLLVGDVNQTKLNKFIAELENKEGKELNYTVMPKSEFQYRRQINDRFLTTLLGSKHQVVLDRHNMLTPKEPKSKKSKE